MDIKGQIVEGILKSESKNEALRDLMLRDYIPIKIKRKFKTSYKIGSKDLYEYANKLCLLVRTGIDIDMSLGILEKESSHIDLKIASGQIRDKVIQGNRLSEAINDTEAFPSIFVNMIKIGEETGELDIVLEELSYFFFKKDRLENKLKNILIYPSILISITTFIVFFLLLFIIPRFKEVFITNDVDLPFITLAIFNLSDALINNPIIVLLFILLIAFFRIIKKHKRVKKFFDRYKIKHSFSKEIYKNYIIVSILKPLSLMFPSGVSMIEILELTKDTMDNFYIKDKLKTIKRSLEKGFSLSDAFIESNLFPNMITSSIRVGEETGYLENVLLDLNNYYEKNLEDMLEKYVAYLEPGIMIFIGMVVGLLVIALIIPIINLMNKFI